MLVNGLRKGKGVGGRALTKKATKGSFMFSCPSFSGFATECHLIILAYVRMYRIGIYKKILV